jgi:hypothetical protein
LHATAWVCCRWQDHSGSLAPTARTVANLCGTASWFLRFTVRSISRHVAVDGSLLLNAPCFPFLQRFVMWQLYIAGPLQVTGCKRSTAAVFAQSMYRWCT